MAMVYLVYQWTTGIILQICVFYFFARFITEYQRKIKSLSSISRSHCEGLLVWFCTLGYATCRIYIAYNMLNLSFLTHQTCILTNTLMLVFQIIQRVTMYLQFATVILTTNELTNLQSINPKKMKLFRFAIIMAGITSLGHIIHNSFEFLKVNESEKPMIKIWADRQICVDSVTMFKNGQQTIIETIVSSCYALLTVSLCLAITMIYVKTTKQVSNQSLIFLFFQKKLFCLCVCVYKIKYKFT